MLGSLGDVVFVASREQLRTFSGFTRSGAPRMAEHEVLSRKAKIEFQAPGLESVGFQMRFDAAYGVNPEQELRRLRQLRDVGAILPMVIGGEFMGNWAIVSLNENHKAHTGRGNLLVAEVEVQLKEVADD